MIIQMFQITLLDNSTETTESEEKGKEWFFLLNLSELESSAIKVAMSLPFFLVNKTSPVWKNLIIKLTPRCTVDVILPCMWIPSHSGNHLKGLSGVVLDASSLEALKVLFLVRSPRAFSGCSVCLTILEDFCQRASTGDRRGVFIYSAINAQ